LCHAQRPIDKRLRSSMLTFQCLNQMVVFCVLDRFIARFDATMRANGKTNERRTIPCDPIP
jgi:hypothetical protein